MGLRAGHAAPALPWAGTFHSVGARLLRDCAPRIGLSEAFTVHDRGDAEDLMGIVRHELGLSATHNRFPLKGTCLAIYAAQSDAQSGAKSSVKAPSGGKHAKSEKHAKSGAHHGAHHAKTGSTSTK